MSLDARIIALAQAIGADIKALINGKVDKTGSVSSVAGRAGAVVLAKADVGLGSADNTPDNSKPVSAPQQAVLDLKAPITNPTFQDGVTAIRQNGSPLEFAAVVYSDVGQIPQFIIKRSRGNVASPSPLQTDDRLGAVLFSGVNSNAGAFSNAAGINVYAAANWTTSSPPTYTTFENTATGASGRSIVMTFDPNNNLLVGPSRTSTSGARLDVQGAVKFSGPLLIGQYTLTTLPSAATYSGYEIDVTNATGGSKRCRSNGAVWQVLNTTTTVS